MIFGSFENCERYFSVNEKLTAAFEFIERAVREGLPVSRYELDSEGNYAFVQEYDTKTESKWEAHRKYIDVQYIIEGVEVMDVDRISSLDETIPYDETRDIAFFEGGEGATRCVVRAGEYAIFFPEDAHRPGLCLDVPAPVRKIVVKIKV
jgi:YhcH/YjgK/YiaL family protein